MTSSADRSADIERFLAGAGWGDAAVGPLAGDASTRRYFRLTRGDERAVLMDAPPRAEAPACPPDATPEQRAALGYNAVARLAGPNIGAFAALAEHLRAQGLSAPRVLAADPAEGFLLLEDLGDALFSRTIAEGAQEPPLYIAAVEALARLHARPAPERIGDHAVLTYDGAAALAETGLFLDWYMGHRAGGPVSDAARADWDVAWTSALEAAATARPVLVLRDYHADNLIWLPDRSGPARAGLLDFQDALAGDPAYDLVSLIEDARRDVSPQLGNQLIGAYLDLTGAPQEDFLRGMAVWAGQRNAKILGIFVRLAERDGKRRYLDLLPRVEGHFARDLRHPSLEGVRDWVGRHAPGLLEEAA